MTDFDRTGPGHAPVETVTEARQGVTGHNVRYVLGWSLAGAAILVIGTAFVFMLAT
jgi:hypothetical protein